MESYQTSIIWIKNVIKNKIKNVIKNKIKNVIKNNYIKLLYKWLIIILLHFTKLLAILLGV